METFDSRGRILPVGPADQKIVSQKITDKEGQGQGPRHQQQKSGGPVHNAESDKDAKITKTKEHVIDIIV